MWQPSSFPGLIVYRFDSQLFFANALYFREYVDALLDTARNILFGRGRVSPHPGSPTV
ncbi:MAG: hypothetical protein JO057_04525 [Chloroflexi bacterium]|nr:hypothetical protein [Chloroflexota bacterium]